MTDEERPESEEQQPDVPVDEPPTSEDEGASAPLFAQSLHIDLTRLKSFAAAGRQIREQVAPLVAAADKLEAMKREVIKATGQQSSFAEQIRQTARAVQTMPQFDFGPNLGRILAANRDAWSTSLRSLIETFRDLIPENLRGFPLADLNQVLKINIEDGTSLAWAPRKSIVTELLQAADLNARSKIFASNAAEIADDVGASLSAITCAEHEVLRAMLLESATAIRAGLYGPAQAASTTVLDTVVNVHMLEFLAYTGRDDKTRTRYHFRPFEPEEWHDATLAEARLALVGAGISTAFSRYRRGSGQASFNRNGSTHHADDGTYSPAHAARALLLAQATLRWLDAAIASERAAEDAA